MFKFLSLAVFAILLAFSVSAFAADNIDKTVELTDGTKVEIDGNHAYAIDHDGNKKALRDGRHKTKDGKTLIVEDGILQEGSDYRKDDYYDKDNERRKNDMLPRDGERQK